MTRQWPLLSPEQCFQGFAEFSKNRSMYSVIALVAELFLPILRAEALPRLSLAVEGEYIFKK